ncbi:hypothetical protein V5799_009804 [Amblyomma americanum]|uniref:Uncharacterized protein n=1 Tax=Amblyomma americanum TaxID=6943 RepID=A0AAQ4F9T0_AMBAM
MTTRTTTTTTIATTTTPAGQAPPLLCSVGLTAALPSQYPPDGACDILIYTHVRVESKMLLAVDTEISYAAFRNACKLYTESTCGLSFDVRSDVDIVVIITSVLTSPNRLPCTTLPANALKSPSTLLLPMANVIMGTPGIRANFTWFLFNVHLTDLTGRCLTGGPFDRVKGFRDFYKLQWQRLNQ